MLHGWLPPTVQVVAAVVLVVAIGWRTRRWRLVWLPVAVVVGVILSVWTHWYVDSQGLAGDPAPSSLWIWVGLTGLAVAVAVLGWRNGRWWRRTVSLVAVPLCLLSAGVARGIHHSLAMLEEMKADVRTGKFRPFEEGWSKR